ncbi:MAG: hypothetical protein M1511_15495, partial [Deltaproteobacteria bacterium]|nr:hypothetical protein [Deltaproteobacteria bacterium]
MLTDLTRTLTVAQAAAKTIPSQYEMLFISKDEERSAICMYKNHFVYLYWFPGGNYEEKIVAGFHCFYHFVRCFDYMGRC